jgi:membrane-bound serine protease (ClpP class)
LKRARLCVLAGIAALAAPVARAAHLNIVTLDGTINPATSEHLQEAVAASERDGALALLVELDTPGGLLTETQEIIQSILNAKVPVIVYVAPQGAWAASAGTFITLAAHVAAMAPGTSIGAASPIQPGGDNERDEDRKRSDVEMEKAEKFTTAFIESIARQRKRNVEWAARAVREAEAITDERALELHVVDLVAANREELLAKLEGREIEIGGEKHKLALAGAEQRELRMTALNRFFNFLADPQVIGLLFMGFALGLWIEFQSPGLILPGALGLLCLVLGLMALQVIPFSGLGLLVMLLGAVLMATEIFVPAYGVLLALGLGGVLWGGSMLFDVPEVDGLAAPFFEFLVPLAAGGGLIAAGVLFAVGRSHRLAQTTGVDELIGRVARAVTPLAPEGTVFARGEYWTARADEPCAANERVEIVAVEGLRLRVRRAKPEA